MSTYREQLERDCFQAEQKWRQARAAAVRIADPLERRAAMLKAGVLADEHQRCLSALFAYDSMHGRTD